MAKIEFLKRITKYCADAEKSTHDVTTKLEEWGATSNEIETILKKLRDENFLDDTRYAKSYASEKWSLDKWGKNKIKNTLLQKNIDEKTIDLALNQIGEREYLESLHEILRQKFRDVKSGDTTTDARRVMMYAQSRGFEEELIAEWLENELSNREE